MKTAAEMMRLFRRLSAAVGERSPCLERCTFSLDELTRLRISAEIRQAAPRPMTTLVRPRPGSARTGAIPEGVPDKRPKRSSSTSSRLIAELELRALFPDRARHRATSRARKASSARAAARPRIRPSATAWASPSRPDARSTCFSSASSRRERNEPPDIDVDFEHERREEVIQYIYEKYGRERAGIAATVITLSRALRAARSRQGVRPVRRRHRRARRHRSGAGRPRASTRRGHARRARPDRAAHRAGARRGREIIGFPRHLSQHVGGFVITREPLDELVPIEQCRDGRTAPSSNGTRTISTRWACSRSMCWRSAC